MTENEKILLEALVLMCKQYLTCSLENDNFFDNMSMTAGESVFIALNKYGLLKNNDGRFANFDEEKFKKIMEKPIEEQSIYDFGKIKFKLWEEGNFIKFQILEMDEKFRKEGNYYTAVNNITIFSCDIPEIYLETKEICLRGRDIKFDNEIVSCENIYKKEVIIEALKDWSENWPGWEEKE